MLFWILFLCIGTPLDGQRAPLISLSEANQRADRAFLAWKKRTPHGGSPALQSSLTPKAITFLAERSQLPLTGMVSSQAREREVQAVAQEYVRTYGKHVPLQEVAELVHDLVMPEYVLLVDPRRMGQRDIVYNQFLEGLAWYVTPAGTTMKRWALKYLTSESQLLALSIIQKQPSRPYYELSDADKALLLSQAARLVTQSFLAHLQGVHATSGVAIPPHLSMAIQERVDIFLKEKFGF